MTAAFRPLGLASRLALLAASTAASIAIFCAPSAHADRGARPALVTTEVVDDNLREPMVAARIGLPAGWASETGVVWRDAEEGSCDSPVELNWSAASPDGLTQMRGLGTETWTSPDSALPCRKADYRGLEDYLRAVIRTGVPHATDVSYADTPALMDRDRAEIRKMIEGVGFEGSITTTTPESGVLRYSAVVDGREIDGALIAVGFVSTIRPAPGSEFEGREPVLFGGTYAFMLVMAPKGGLDLDLARAVWDSARTDPEWTAAATRIMSGEASLRPAAEEDCG